MAQVLLVTINRFGVLARITSIISSAGANIETVAAYPIAGSEMSIVHLRIDANSVLTERLLRRLSRLVDVAEVKVDDEAVTFVTRIDKDSYVEHFYSYYSSLGEMAPTAEHSVLRPGSLPEVMGPP